MKLLDDWRKVLRKSWSIRLIIVSGILTGLEVALPLFETRFSTGVFASLSFLFTSAALIARLIAQKEISQ